MSESEGENSEFEESVHNKSLSLGVGNSIESNEHEEMPSPKISLKSFPSNYYR